MSKGLNEFLQGSWDHYVEHEVDPVLCSVTALIMDQILEDASALNPPYYRTDPAYPIIIGGVEIRVDPNLEEDQMVFTHTPM
jgi:hypothetical protein